MIDCLTKRSSDFALRLATSSKTVSSIETVSAMLRLMWPNPDRHGTGAMRSPTEEEAGNVVQLALLMAGWARSGALTRLSPRDEES